jgi:SAM-dependent methyltransferase
MTRRAIGSEGRDGGRATDVPTKSGPDRAYSTMSPAIQDAHNYTRWVLEVFAPYMGPRLLEVGTGYGNYRRYMRGVTAYTSIDVDEAALRRAEAEAADGRYVLGDVASPEFSQWIAPGTMDAVLCVNVLEHVADESQALRNMYDALAPGGHLMLYVPAFMALYSDLDRLAGHLRRYTRDTMRRRVAPLGGRIVRLEYFNPIGGLGWWVNKFRHVPDLSEAAVNRQIQIFDRYVVPLSRAANHLTRTFFGQSLVCVVSK